MHYANAGLSLAHYDARAHLVVARRIFDSLTPGWQQIGAVWLPLPHVLNAMPVQIDAWYRSGASGTAISVASLALCVWAVSWMLLRLSGSIAAGLACGALLLLNPNVLYLQSTPMTEPLLFGTTLLAVAVTAAWIDRGARGAPRAAGLALVAACMTRYEAWPVTAALVALAGVVLLRRGVRPWDAGAACARLAAYPFVALILFIANSRWTVGEWFVSGGFFVAENEALGRPGLAWDQVREGLYQLSGTAWVWPAYAGVVLIVGACISSRRHAPLALLLAPAAAAALPWYAYLHGHPLRIRYSLPLVVACAVLAAGGVSLLPHRLRVLAAAGIAAFALSQASPLDRTAPLITESQRDVTSGEGRQRVTAYLQAHYDRTTIMMSMGSLAHYMHDLSRAGFRIHDFMHEGNGELWPSAVLLGPRGFVGWVAIEERAEGGDALFRRQQRFRRFLDGFERVAEGGGVALYRATPARRDP